VILSGTSNVPRVAIRRVRRNQEPRGWAWALGVAIAKPALLATTRQNWVDGHKIPATGGCIIVVNHISHVDPLTTAHLLWDHGRIPRYLAKSGLFKSRVLGGYLTSAGMIPVERLSKNAAGAFEAAVAAVHAGECVVVYPEGTITRDPGTWPMTGKSGAARIALETRAPVIPIGQWGANDVLAPYGRRLHLFPRSTVTMKVGDPIDLSDLAAQQHTAPVIAEATERIMDAITALVAEVRGEDAPAQRFDPRTAGVSSIGNPHKKGSSS
jgi:1-acyl-sn-glycerol-3-phosphate acyltransferase